MKHHLAGGNMISKLTSIFLLTTISWSHAACQGNQKSSAKSDRQNNEPAATLSSKCNTALSLADNYQIGVNIINEIINKRKSGEYRELLDEGPRTNDLFTCRDLVLKKLESSAENNVMRLMEEKRLPMILRFIILGYPRQRSDVNLSWPDGMYKLLEKVKLPEARGKLSGALAVAIDQEFEYRNASKFPIDVDLVIAVITDLVPHGGNTVGYGLKKLAEAVSSHSDLERASNTINSFVSELYLKASKGRASQDREIREQAIKWIEVYQGGLDSVKYAVQTDRANAFPTYEVPPY